ncbi:MAG: hypothetical protein OEY79_00090 [Anaplasmataceae bacterium]|nr:hypothetical protein [Anaplasmataceae bacterium]
MHWDDFNFNSYDCGYSSGLSYASGSHGFDNNSLNLEFETFKKDISKDMELKNAQTKLWLMSTTISCTAIIGLLMTVFKFWH